MADGRRQKAEGRWQKAERRTQKAEGRRRNAERRKQMAEGRWQMADGRTTNPFSALRSAFCVRSLPPQYPRPLRVDQRLERIGVVGHDEPPAGPEVGDDVVAELGVGMVCGEAVAESDEAAAFVSGEGIDAFAGGAALARLHFRDDEGAAAAEDEVDLTVRAARVLRDDDVAAEAIEPFRPPFAEFAEELRRKFHAHFGSFMRISVEAARRRCQFLLPVEVPLGVAV